jgi:hypothetical protein
MSSWTFEYFEMTTKHPHLFPPPRGPRLCRNPRNRMDVMLSEAKHLVFSGMLLELRFFACGSE